MQPNLSKPEENEEIDVTEIIERLEALEKENSSLKEKVAGIESRLCTNESNIDELDSIIHELLT